MFLLIIGDCYKVAPSKSLPEGEALKPSLPGRVWVGLAFPILCIKPTKCSKILKFSKPIIKPKVNETHLFTAAFAAGLLCHRPK
jgi:hypothetical protein